MLEAIVKGFCGKSVSFSSQPPASTDFICLLPLVLISLLPDISLSPILSTPRPAPLLFSNESLTNSVPPSCTKAPGGQPFRLFFSNPDADVDWHTPNTGKTTSLSAAKAILNSPILKPSPARTDTSYYYEMYKLKSASITGYAAFGQVLFGKNKDNNLVTWWDSDMWVKMG